MKRLNDILGKLALIVVGLVFFILFLPIILILAPLNTYRDWKREKDFKNYLLSLRDKNFFCYNNRNDSKEFIEKEVIPKLDERIEIIYLDGREAKSAYVKEHILLALYKLDNYIRFPHLLKIRDGQIIDESVNNEFYNVMNQNKPMDKLLTDIHEFFGLRIKNQNAA
jgi:hypothetical protein